MLVLGLLLYKQRPAYDMRMSDWSSDVCSSDRVRRAGQRQVGVAEPGRPHRRRLVEIRCFFVRRQVDDVADARPTQTPDVGGHKPARRNDAGRRGGRVGDLRHADRERTSGVEGTSVAVRGDHGGGSSIKKKRKRQYDTIKE